MSIKRDDHYEETENGFIDYPDHSTIVPRSTIIFFTIKTTGLDMKWDITKIGFLHQPEDFLGSFDNDKMQLRHEQQVREKLKRIKSALDDEINPLKAMLILNRRDHVQFLCNNLKVFQQEGELEKAILILYRKKNGPFSTPDEIETWSDLINHGEKSRFEAIGDSIPFSKTTVYRGAVIGSPKGLSWSPDRQRAEWYADRWKDPALGGGNVFEVDLTSPDVLVYLTDKHEEELIVSPSFIHTATIRTFGLAV